MRKAIQILLCAAWIVVAVPVSLRGEETVRRPLAFDEQARFDYYFFEAQRQKDIHRYDAQLEALRMCLEIDSANPAAQAEIGILYARMNDLPRAARCLEKAVKAFPNNWWYRIHYISLLSGREQFVAAVEQAEELRKHYPLREEVYTLLNTLYKQTGEYDKAIEALNRLERFLGVNENITFEKFQLYTLLNKKKQATAEFDRLIEKYPRENRYKVLLADIFLEQGEAKKAFDLYQEVRKNDPNNPFVYVSLANYYNKQNQLEKAMEWIVSALKNPRLPSETKMEILGQYVDRLLANEKTIGETESLFRMLIEMYPFEEMPYAYYALFLQNQKRAPEALAELETLIAINPKNQQAWKTALQIMTQQEDTVGIVHLTERAIKELPQVPEFYFYRSMAQYQMGDLEAALQTNEAALQNLATASDFVLSTFYGQTGDIYFQMKNKAKAFEYYEKALEANPSNVYIMNNYAYYLAEENQDLRKAERMSGKTVEIEPNNSTYLDTYAWILYRQGNYSLARLYMDKAVSSLKAEERESEVIYDHAGDIYRALDDTAKAIEMWEKALSIKDETGEIKKKIENAKANLQ